MKHILIFVFTISLVLFVLVPATFIFLVKISNPMVIGPVSGMVPTYKNDPSANQINPNINNVVINDKFNNRIGNNNTDEQSKNQSIISILTNVWKDNNYQQTEIKTIDCKNPNESFELPVRDAQLFRKGEKSIVSSEMYHYNITMPAPIYDWQYTNGVLTNESASFVYDEKIINILARKSKVDCNNVAQTIYKKFHTKNDAVEYFSSQIYLDQGRNIGLTEAVLNTIGIEKIKGHTFYWYTLDEKFKNSPPQIVSTIWFSTRVGRTEYWFVFRGYKNDSLFLRTSLDEFAKKFIKSVQFDSVL